MKKILCISLLLTLSFQSSHAQDMQAIQKVCSYITGDDNDLVEIFLTLGQEKNEFKYTTTELTRPVLSQFDRVSTKGNSIILEGTLPSPWQADSRFLIQLNDKKNFIKYIVPGQTNLKPQNLSCTDN